MSCCVFSGDAQWEWESSNGAVLPKGQYGATEPGKHTSILHWYISTLTKKAQYLMCFYLAGGGLVGEYSKRWYRRLLG